MKNYIKFIAITLVLVALGSCEVEDFADLNSPSLEDIEANPSIGDIQDLIGGMQASMRNNLGTYFDDVGVIGREFYRFSSSDPRFTADLLGRETAILDNNTFYITNPWAARYNVVKSANIVLKAVDNTTADISTAEKDAIRGFAKTIKAHELLLNLNLTYNNGIRIDVEDPDNLGPINDYQTSLTQIREILDEGATNLSNASGASFPFDLSAGFAGFSTPSSFLEFNKALGARIAAYQGDLDAVTTYLNTSFFSLTGDLRQGTYYVFSSDGNDVFNPMFFALNSSTAGARIMQPSFLTDANPDDERLSKVVERDEPLTLDGLTGSYDFFVYTTNTSPIPIIRNEELVLLYAEANHIDAPAEAVNAINVVRNAAGLPNYTGGTDPQSLVDEILNQRRYSLYGEGHRWIDMRRFNKLDELPIDRPQDDVWVEFPIPLNENI
ncbi:RagB/SusD family nutrient uptake outer membrane protein [Galbibacter sp. BG1]|uniref:RagB/SusD family nutrient uptake outer membrane protein n=1 Tax=Galbibacter sp. BG1 TaxID=1170699 RepID=UPI0015BB8BFC|nr:RagB/SusD family nutrient uptake outer membrane protein [Galbibacter sp. BG1]QLE00612.1 RagB/SusD family nutrient uptake outer membrane protein [Galbibacter sp. BG1]